MIRHLHEPRSPGTKTMTEIKQITPAGTAWSDRIHATRFNYTYQDRVLYAGRVPLVAVMMMPHGGRIELRWADPPQWKDLTPPETLQPQPAA